MTVPCVRSHFSIHYRAWHVPYTTMFQCPRSTIRDIWRTQNLPLLNEKNRFLDARMTNAAALATVVTTQRDEGCYAFDIWIACSPESTLESSSYEGKSVLLYTLHLLHLSILERDPPLLLSWRFLPFFPPEVLFGSFSWSDVSFWGRDVCVQIVKHSETNLWNWAIQINWIEMKHSFFYCNCIQYILLFCM